MISQLQRTLWGAATSFVLSGYLLLGQHARLSKLQIASSSGVEQETLTPTQNHRAHSSLSDPKLTAALQDTRNALQHIERSQDVSWQTHAEILLALYPNIEDLSFSEAVELANRLKKEAEETEDIVLAIAASEIFTLQSVANPEKILSMIGELPREGFDYHTPLASLARQDPFAAWEWVANADLPANDKRNFRQYIARIAFSLDVAIGVSLISESLKMQDGSWLPDGEILVLPPGSEKELVKVLGEEKYATIRKPVIELVLLGTARRAGLEGFLQQTDDLGLAEKDFASFLRDQEILMALVPAQGELTMATILDIPDYEAATNTAAYAVFSWAQRDIEAASNWLGTQPPSPRQNKIISEFVKIAVKVDPIAALAWVGEITDPKMREAEKEDILLAWKKQAPEEAAAWTTRNE